MPNFPTYYGPPLPKVLNPLNPAHYWLVFKWVFFQQSRLKHYLYQIDPELYRATGLRSLLKTLRLPGYRNVYVIAVIVSLLVAIGMVCAVAAVQATTIGLLGLLLITTLGVAGGMMLGVAGGVVVGAGSSVASGVASGVAFSMTLGVAGGVTLGVRDGVASGNMLSMTFAVVVGVTCGVIFNVFSSEAFGVAFGVVGSIAFGIIGGVMWGATVIGGDKAVDVEVFVTAAVVSGVAWLVGASRLLFYPWELLNVLFTLSWQRRSVLAEQVRRHPIWWDELAVWPLSGLSHILRYSLDADYQHSFVLAVHMLANPFQRWIAQRALSDWLMAQSDPLKAFQRLTHTAMLNEYVLPPSESAEFRDFPSARVVLLGEIAQLRVDGCDIDGMSISERWVWQLTRRLRRRQPTPLSRFSSLLYYLIRNEDWITEAEFTEIRSGLRLAEFRAYYKGIGVYPHGDEVANSWASLAALLEAISLDQISAAHEQLAWIPHLEQPYLAPEVIGALAALGDVSRAVGACLQATSLPNKTVALNQAAGGLQELAAYIEKELWPPEKALYLVLIKHWQSLVAAEQGRLGASALQQMSPSERLATGLIDRTSNIWQRPTTPLNNPYIAGDPVMPPLFVGRRDIFTSINETWRAKASPDSIILYGHRRMGKSSILRNLDQAAPGRVIACVNLQGETSFVASTADLLLALADRIYAEVKRARPEAALTQPPADQFTTPASAQIQFNRFMEQVRTALGDSGLILALDEFEAIEEAVRDGKVGKEIYQFLRAKTQEPWITVVFGGLHTLDEMSRDYAQPFYGSYQNIVVSYLAPEDAYHLITNPTPDFRVNYESAAVERIIAATGSQPYLVQLVCRDALDHLNHELFDEHLEREVKLTLADVEAVLGDDLFRRGTGYFDGVWTQVSESAQQDLLRCMAQRDTPWTLVELQEATHHSPEDLRQHLQLAERRDILRQRDGARDGVWEFCVPLMRKWIIWRARP